MSEEPKAKRPRLTKKQRKGRVETRKFDMSKYSQRYIALKFAYIGWDYHGFASQAHTENTVEEHIYKALEKSCLIESRDSCNYTRGARTDKGVSAIGSVISCRVRSQIKPNTSETNEMDSNKDPDEEELNYPLILNRILPNEIRCVGWAPVDANFNARFNATHRVYKYFFVSKNLNLEKMKEAGNLLIGDHDFRNFCKMDVENVDNYRRKIISFDLNVIGSVTFGDFSEKICEVQLKGQAFLWHQVRCIMAVLFMVGEENESPEIVSYLLDVEKCKEKPIYQMASEQPLLLYDCFYANLQWKVTENVKQEQEKIQSGFINRIHNSLLNWTLVACMATTVSSKPINFLQVNSNPNTNISHVRLLDRPREATYEEKLKNIQQKRSRQSSNDIGDE
eukprot:c22021_g2_i1.p1 GENE.c22021_g2_i1~~c22021_g2_i1.p1  ORF type:complete len:401 (+),score=130.00 c22021_g2_i1:25-1203(+)